MKIPQINRPWDLRLTPERGMLVRIAEHHKEEIYRRERSPHILIPKESLDDVIKFLTSFRNKLIKQGDLKK